MGVRSDRGGGVGARGEICKRRGDPLGLCLCAGHLELPDTTPHGRSHLENAAGGSNEEARRVLAAALLPLGGSSAAHWAESLLGRFGDIGRVLATDPEAIAAALGDDRVGQFLSTIRQLLLLALRPEPFREPVLSTSNAVLDYLLLAMGGCRHETLRALFLDGGNRLIRDEQIGAGTVNEAPIYPREIIRRALDLGATGLILAHNHPSGDPAPSEADVRQTINLVDAAKVFGVRVHDHLIIARSGWTSLRALGRL